MQHAKAKAWLCHVFLEDLSENIYFNAQLKNYFLYYLVDYVFCGEEGRAASIPISTHCNPPVPELITLSAAFPIWGIAL